MFHLLFACGADTATTTDPAGGGGGPEDPVGIEASVTYLGDAAVGPTVPWEGTERARFVDPITGNVACEFAWVAVSWAEADVDGLPDPYADVPCADAAGVSCTWSATVHLFDGAEVLGDCKPFGLDPIPAATSGPFGYGWHPQWDDGVLPRGPRFVEIVAKTATAEAHWVPWEAAIASWEADTVHYELPFGTMTLTEL